MGGSMALLFFLFSSIAGSGFFKHVADRIKTAVRSGDGRKSPVTYLSGKNRRVSTVFVVVILLLLCLTVSSCGALIYDIIEGGDRTPQEYSLTVVYDYTGSYSGSYIYIAVFGSQFSGNEPDLVYMSDPLTSYSGSHIFYELDEMSYGVLAFIDHDADGEPSSGDPYEFYDNMQDNPSEIYLASNMSVYVSFDDSYSWTDGFYENFDDGIADNWIDDGSGMWRVSGYTYNMQGNRTDSYTYSYYNDEFDDFTYEVSVEQNNGDLASKRGVFFRAQNPAGIKNYTLEGYVLWIDSEQNWGFERISGGYAYTLTSGYAPTLLYGLGNSNTIMVNCVGSGFEIYFNGSYVTSLFDNQFSYGKVGLYCYDGTGVSFPDEFWFDNVVLY